MRAFATFESDGPGAFGNQKADKMREKPPTPHKPPIPPRTA
jgi:hypothetical protein